MLLVTSMGCSRRGAASDLCKGLDIRRGSLAFVHQTRGHWLKERVWPLHTSRRVPSGCTKIFEPSRSRPCRRLGRASDGRGRLLPSLGRVLINAQIAVPLSESCSQINQNCAGCRAALAGTTTENAIGCAAKRRTKDRRTAHGNGTAFSAVAPSKRPVFAAHRSNIREWYCPHARIAGHLTFHLLVRFRAHCGFLSG